ncbi:Oxysterol-binding protein [Trichinella spiralis]|uniref:Oxysterol-binding protein n=1 Tax=Trichinella spiralis TaxID=6334 RepID=A0ABR3K7R1_TRISP
MPWIQNYPKPQAIPPYMPFQVFDLCSACKTEVEWRIGEIAKMHPCLRMKLWINRSAPVELQESKTKEDRC